MGSLSFLHLQPPLRCPAPQRASEQQTMPLLGEVRAPEKPLEADYPTSQNQGWLFSFLACRRLQSEQEGKTKASLQDQFFQKAHEGWAFCSKHVHHHPGFPSGPGSRGCGLEPLFHQCDSYCKVCSLSPLLPPTSTKEQSTGHWAQGPRKQVSASLGLTTQACRK